jgi:hypothetical protein
MLQTRIVTTWDQAPLDIKYNYWGSSEEVDVVGSIWDFYDDSTRTRGIYLPYLLSPDPNGDISNSTTEALQFIGDSSSVKGDLVENLTLTSMMNPYNLTGTLFIPQYTTLTIEPGVIFYCHKSSGIRYLLIEINCLQFSIRCGRHHCCKRN